ncbi:protein TolB [Iodidimonas muriae]|uniref:Tol-Pal system protein TolB n=2 Tax=Iodidimonas muriae TaxID=261467 RepID=A0ABQ2LCB4_9PROT|nr:protein TolB [Kordiimonadales bacterium JCM 17843]GGO10197.1 protein TolB [Iodidimonas muriae]
MVMSTFKRWSSAVFLALAFLATLSPANRAWAVLQVDVSRGNVEPLPIAIPDFIPVRPVQTTDGSLEAIGGQIASVVSADLLRSGLFRPLDRSAFISQPQSADIRPRFANWRAIASQALVTGQVDMRSDGLMVAEFRLWDVLSEAQLTGLRYTAQPGDWRRIAHKIADSIYERLTGEDGYFDSRVVYIAESGSRINRRKRLAIMDQDGHNHLFLTNGDDLVLTPRFSPNRQEITYLAYYNDKPRVYLYNLDTGKHEVLGDFPNMTFAPRFSPDGDRVIMSLAENGNSDIYEMDLRTRRVRRLTSHPGIDTSPSYSPDGRHVVFNSNRGGSQQLYVMRADGSNVERISFGGGRYATPVWSPRGDLIAFTKIGDSKFRIGVMKPDGSGERVLTDSYQDEGPTWSPNGRVLMFFRLSPESGQTTLRSVDLTGYNERLVPTPLDASDPAWSPILEK